MEKRDFLRVYRDFMNVEGRKIDAKYLKRLKEDILRAYLKDKTRPDEYLLYHFDRKNEA